MVYFWKGDSIMLESSKTASGEGRKDNRRDKDVQVRNTEFEGETRKDEKKTEDEERGRDDTKEEETREKRRKENMTVL